METYGTYNFGALNTILILKMMWRADFAWRIGPELGYLSHIYTMRSSDWIFILDRFYTRSKPILNLNFNSNILYIKSKFWMRSDKRSCQYKIDYCGPHIEHKQANCVSLSNYNIDKVILFVNLSIAITDPTLSMK